VEIDGLLTFSYSGPWYTLVEKGSHKVLAKALAKAHLNTKLWYAVGTLGLLFYCTKKDI